MVLFLGTCTYKDLVRTNSHSCRNLGTVSPKTHPINAKGNVLRTCLIVGTYAL